MGKTAGGADTGKNLLQEKEERREFLKVAAKFAAVLAALGISGEEWAGMARQQAEAADLQQAPPPTQLKRGAPEIKGEHKGELKLSRPGSRQEVAIIVQDAIKSRNMEEAIRKSQAKLSEDQLKALRSLTPQELEVLNRVQGKLGPHAAGNGTTGGFIY